MMINTIIHKEVHLITRFMDKIRHRPEIKSPSSFPPNIGATGLLGHCFGSID